MSFFFFFKQQGETIKSKADNFIKIIDVVKNNKQEFNVEFMVNVD